jgi:hypothetical protein
LTFPDCDQVSKALNDVLFLRLIGRPLPFLTRDEDVLISPFFAVSFVKRHARRPRKQAGASTLVRADDVEEDLQN